jgi:pimeloyl-ACP methyl ester carboxylesterase
VLLLHGLGWDHSLWNPTVERLAKNYRAIAADTRGHGATDRPDGPYDMAMFARDTAALADALGLTGICVIGLSQGGMVAQNLALLRPDLVSSLVLISTSCKSAPSLRDNMEARIAAMDKMGPEAAAGIAAESIFSPGWRAANPAALARFISWRSVMPSAPINAATRALYEFNLSSDLPRIAVPTLVVAGAEDVFADVKREGIQPSNETMIVRAAQVIIDQFIVSGLAKWGQTSRLTLLLPHGYEGAGPEHSSARLERFLQLAAEGNIRVANLTTPAQYFHLLRRQARIAKQRPLVIMTPKSLLRLPQATNRIEHLADTKFFPVLGEPRVPVEKVTRLVLCTGKIYYDLLGHPARQDNEGVAIGRVELLYPFPEGQLRELIGTIGFTLGLCAAAAVVGCLRLRAPNFRGRCKHRPPTSSWCGRRGRRHIAQQLLQPQQALPGRNLGVAVIHQDHA